VGSVIREPLSAVAFALTRKLHLTGWISEVRLNTIAEPAPDPDSRITLGDDVDALGLRCADVHWRLGSLVRRTFDRTWAVIGDGLRRAGIAEVEQPEPIEDKEWPRPESLRYYLWGHGKLIDQGDAWPRLPDWTWHHMGGTRMHESPRHGVVDANQRVHGMSNLWITGGSVFPTGAANFPTLTIVALTLRLADHLARRLGRPLSQPASRPVEEPAALAR
jgi:choline dehydrogenase-like flavoprotein